MNPQNLNTAQLNAGTIIQPVHTTEDTGIIEQPMLNTVLGNQIDRIFGIWPAWLPNMPPPRPATPYPPQQAAVIPPLPEVPPHLRLPQPHQNLEPVPLGVAQLHLHEPQPELFDPIDPNAAVEMDVLIHRIEQFLASIPEPPTPAQAQQAGFYVEWIDNVLRQNRQHRFNRIARAHVQLGGDMDLWEGEQHVLVGGRRDAVDRPMLGLPRAFLERRERLRQERNRRNLLGAEPLVNVHGGVDAAGVPVGRNEPAAELSPRDQHDPRHRPVLQDFIDRERRRMAERERERAEALRNNLAHPVIQRMGLQDATDEKLHSTPGLDKMRLANELREAEPVRRLMHPAWLERPSLHDTYPSGPYQAFDLADRHERYEAHRKNLRKVQKNGQTKEAKVKQEDKANQDQPKRHTPRIRGWLSKDRLRLKPKTDAKAKEDVHMDDAE